MKPFPRPRTWIAGCAGIAAGLVVWMLPPLPDWSITAEPGCRLHSLSLGGRHLMTYRFDNEGRVVFKVWDSADPEREPITVTGDTWNQSRFLPDGKSFLIVSLGTRDVREVKWFNVSGGRLIKSWQLDDADDIISSPEGVLYYFKGHRLYRLEDNQEVSRLPESIDDLKRIKNGSHFNGFAIYVKNSSDGNHCDVVLYDPLLSRQVARMTIPGEITQVKAVSEDGQVVVAAPDIWRRPDEFVIVDGNGITRTINRSPYLPLWWVSQKGDLIATSRLIERPSWLEKWWPFEQKDATWDTDIIDWRTGVKQASFRSIVQVAFAPDNEQIAMRHSDGVIEGYAWPLRTPWRLLAAAMLGAAVGVWSIGWLWTRWRERRLRLEVSHETTS